MFLAASWCLGRFVWVLPIISLIWLFTSLATTYGIAVALNHTFPDFPYISYTGVEVPERGIFTFSIAVTAIMLAANAEMRFLFVKQVFHQKKATKNWKNANVAGLVLGIVSSFGLLLVGCFQVDKLKPPHYFGAFLCFVVAIVYLWLQTVLTWKLRQVSSKPDDKKIWRAIRWLIWLWQILNSAAATILLVLFSISKVTYKIQRSKNMGTKWDTLRGVFLLSTSTEWLLAFSIMIFVLTYIPGFKRLKVVKVRVTLDQGERVSEETRLEENGEELLTMQENGCTA